MAAEAAPEAIEAGDVAFTYDGTDVAALRGVSFSQARGEVFGIMGASGAGKSTLAKCLNRIVPEFEGGEFRGSIRINGASIETLRVCDVALRVGMVFQDFESQLFSTNVAHEVAFAMEQAGMNREEINRRLWPALEAVGLRGFEHRDPTSLSGGEKQRLAIASVLAMRPDVIVLDEPTTDLDPEGKLEVFDLIRRLRDQGLSLIVIEHESHELRDCDRVLIMRDGAIVHDGAPAEVMLNLDQLEACGVHPPGLNRAMQLLGIGGHARSVDHAYSEIVRSFPKLREMGLSLEGEKRVGKATVSEPLLSIENLSFKYPEGSLVLDAIDLEIAPGEFVAIVGQNGSGKTTLAKQIVGLLKPVAGRIRIGRRDRAELKAGESAHEVGYVFQNPDHQIFASSVTDEVKFGPTNFGLAPTEIEHRCNEVLRAVDLDNERDSDPFLLTKGQRQRLAVASVLALRPRLLILDEPTTGLDYRETRRMMSLVADLNRAGTTIVVITHTPWLVAEYARRVVLMRKGHKLFDGNVRDFFASTELLRHSSFRPPEVTELSLRLGTVALTPEELAAWVREHA